MNAKLLLVFVVFLIAPSAHAAPASTPVVLGQSYELHSEVLDQTRRINVYLPFGYGESEQSYPVLYLLDGGVAEDFFHIAGIASLAADFRNIEPFLVVGIEGIDRYHDMTDASTVASDLERIPNPGGSAKFREFLATELQPFVNENFRVTGERVLIGESMAGLFVVETLLRAPNTFEGYIAVSPSLWWNDESLAHEAAALISRDDFPAGRRVYLTIADEGDTMREGTDLVADAVASQPAITATYRPMDHESHGTIFHPAALDAVRWMFPIEASPEAH